MLYQLHWHDRIGTTEFVGQSDSIDQLNNLMARRIDEMPYGWMPLICTQDSEYFVVSNSVSV